MRGKLGYQCERRWRPNARSLRRAQARKMRLASGGARRFLNRGAVTATTPRCHDDADYAAARGPKKMWRRVGVERASQRPSALKPFMKKHARAALRRRRERMRVRAPRTNSTTCHAETELMACAATLKRAGCAVYIGRPGVVFEPLLPDSSTSRDDRRLERSTTCHRLEHELLRRRRP